MKIFPSLCPVCVNHTTSKNHSFTLLIQKLVSLALHTLEIISLAYLLSLHFDFRSFRRAGEFTCCVLPFSVCLKSCVFIINSMHSFPVCAAIVNTMDTDRILVLVFFRLNDSMRLVLQYHMVLSDCCDVHSF
ncbi:hypothetical protein PRUPE_7G005400 [Prunus persica]|uniref:Uncharacterized protein n=1 Tax=Prunus persica TaxID=3760 RepID=A0A251N4H3_PRUPE|nr:hypothetical protein PRUPE_7G005400 [Prunus persica]